VWVGCCLVGVVVCVFFLSAPCGFAGWGVVLGGVVLVVHFVWWGIIDYLGFFFSVWCFWWVGGGCFCVGDLAGGGVLSALFLMSGGFVLFWWFVLVFLGASEGSMFVVWGGCVFFVGWVGVFFFCPPPSCPSSCAEYPFH